MTTKPRPPLSNLIHLALALDAVKTAEENVQAGSRADFGVPRDLIAAGVMLRLVRELIDGVIKAAT